MGVEPIPAGLWMQVPMMPWVLHRANSLLAALPLTQVWEMEELTIGKESRPVKDQLMQLMISSKLASNSSPSPGQMVQAMTLSAVGDRSRWDLRLPYAAVGKRHGGPAIKCPITTDFVTFTCDLLNYFRYNTSDHDHHAAGLRNWTASSPTATSTAAR